MKIEPESFSNMCKNYLLMYTNFPACFITAIPGPMNIATVNTVFQNGYFHRLNIKLAVAMISKSNSFASILP